MQTTEKRFTHAANILAISSGLGLAIFRYGSGNTDPYSNVGSAWEPPFHDFHVAIVPLLVFAAGVIWQTHIWPRWKSRLNFSSSKRVSGLGLMIMLIPMIASGYFVQITVEPQWRILWVWIHGGTSIIWSVVSIWHVLAVIARRK